VPGNAIGFEIVPDAARIGCDGSHPARLCGVAV
jgi:hypothetical protein